MSALLSSTHRNRIDTCAPKSRTVAPRKSRQRKARPTYHDPQSRLASVLSDNCVWHSHLWSHRERFLTNKSRQASTLHGASQLHSTERYRSAGARKHSSDRPPAGVLARATAIVAGGAFRGAQICIPAPSGIAPPPRLASAVSRGSLSDGLTKPCHIRGVTNSS